MRGWLLLWGVVASAFGAGEGRPVDSRLCLGGECRDYRCGDSAAPAPDRRTFTITGSTGDTYDLGVLPPGTSAIPCELGGVLELTIALSKPVRRGTARVVVEDSHGNRWELPLKEPQFLKPLTVRAPAGAYVIAVESAHHQSLSRKVIISRERSRVAIELQPLPVLSAVVLTRGTRSPLAGAQARTDAGDVATTDAGGRFILETNSETWPKTITVSAGGYAEATVPLPPAHVSKSLGDIVLGRGGRIAVELKRQDAQSELRVELQKLRSGKIFGDGALKTLSVPAGEPLATLEFENVEAGDYVVMAKGSGQCDRRGERVSVSEGETRSVTMPIVPYWLRVKVEMAGQPLAGATITVRSDSGHWQEKLTADPAGEAGVGLWQGGELILYASLPNVMTMPYRESRDLAEGKDVEWLLDVPDRAIEGVVVDAATGDPIPKAYIALHMNRSSDGSGEAVKAKTDDTGHFRFAPVDYGAHRLEAVAGAYLPAEVKVLFSEPQQVENVTVRLDPASLVHIKVVDARNVPIAGAALIEYRRAALIGYGLTDDTGTAQMPAGDGESYDVYVIPRDGSFGFTQLTSEASQVSVQIADGSSQIVLRCESESHAPIPGIWVGVRYNGRPIPVGVMNAIANAQGVRLMTGPDGQIRVDRMPTGLYEFWPVGSTSELRAISDAAGTAPAKIAVNSGDNVAVMTFAQVPQH
jgi:hypothetical protein